MGGYIRKWLAESSVEAGAQGAYETYIRSMFTITFSIRKITEMY